MVRIIRTFRNSKIIDLIKRPILDNENLKNIPKVLVLQHCRGDEQIENDGSVTEFETDGPVTEWRHRMVCSSMKLFKRNLFFKNDTVIFWATSEGNPAIRSSSGSIYIQYFFQCLERLNPKTDDINDLQRWLNQCLMDKSYVVKQRRLLICPTMQSTLQKRLHL